MNRFLIFIILSILITSCSQQTEINPAKPLTSVIQEIEIPAIEIDKSKLFYETDKSCWTYENELFSGYAVICFPDSTLMEKFGIFNGKKQNESVEYFADGHLKYSANYENGKLHNEKKFWSSDSSHILVSQLNYHFGKLHGEQKKWYATGEIFKVLQMNMGKEEGMQKAFRKNGDLFANYEARAGRIFGLKRAALCFGLENEKVQYEN